ncbi:MAG: hypothetical protein IID44_25820 [Planctomycetes bacterium]|nr:hypothetical protein [Planctomycetota bacterium]
MVSSNRGTPEYARALELFRTIWGRVRGPRAAERLWEELPEQDRQRLGGDMEGAYYKYGGAVGMWKVLRGVSDQRAVMDVAELIECMSAKQYKRLLRMSGEVSDDPEEAIQRAIASGYLVLVEKDRTAHWRGELIDIDWFRFDVLWGYLWSLAHSAKAGCPIDRFSFGGDLHPEYLTKQKSRLTNLEGFPYDLGDTIVPAGCGTQTLDLERETIHVIERESIEVAREYVG